MLRSLRTRMAVAFVTAILAIIIVLLVASSRVTTSQFGTYMWEGRMMAGAKIEIELAQHYARVGGWRGAGSKVRELATRYGNKIVLWDSDGRVLASADERGAGATPAPGMGMMMGGGMHMRRPLASGDRTVGFVAYSTPTRTALSGPELGFIAGVNRYLLFGGILAAILAAGLGIMLAQKLTSPLKRLTAAARAISAGKLDQRVDVRATTEEVEELADAFNTMAANLEQAEELRRNLTADIAHELRTPLTAMKVHLEGALDGAVPRSEETIRTLHRETERLTELVEELRDLSMAEAGRLRLDVERVDLGEVAHHEVALMRPRFNQAGVDLALGAPADPALLQGDPLRLAQILKNLLENALAHTPRGGRVVVSLAPERDRLVLSVRDTGPGIAPEALPFVFERFYKADAASVKGSGIGLTITKRLVEAHKGTIAARSAPGEGTEMTATFPSAAS